MFIPFSRTLRSIERDSDTYERLRYLTIVLLLGGLAAWMLTARVPIYALSASGRVEVAATTHRAASSVTGRVTALITRLGATVAPQALLVQLDDAVERRRLDETLAALRALDLRLAALSAQIVAEEEVRTHQQRASAAAEAHARVTLAEADEQAAYHGEVRALSAGLRQADLIPALDALRTDQELRASRWEVRAAQAVGEKQQVEGRYADRVQAARIAGLARERADLEALRITAHAAVSTARAELERRVIRAPIAGRVGSLAPLEVGDVVQAGDVLATVVPREPLRVVAEFAPAEAMGRVHPGQSARVRLSGFSAVEYGGLEAVVRRVASETQRGSVRVELALAENPGTRLPLQHGLPGAVEVRVDSVAPFWLVVRSMGAALDPPARAPHDDADLRASAESPWGRH